MQKLEIVFLKLLPRSITLFIYMISGQSIHCEGPEVTTTKKLTKQNVAKLQTT